MKFGRVPLAEARGHVLGHNVSHEGRRVLRKGRRLGVDELALLGRLGLESVYVAELAATDVDEDTAAGRIAAALALGGDFEPRAAAGGRVSVRATRAGLLQVDGESLLKLNLIAGVALATLPHGDVVSAGQMVATLKIIPFALPEQGVRGAEQLAATRLLSVRAAERRRVHVLVSGGADRRERLLAAYRAPLQQRLLALGVADFSADYVSLGNDPERTLADAMAQHLGAGVELLIVVGETATMDGDDLAPRAIRRAGGRVDVVGAPVFPGNLLLLGYRGSAAILGAPGCVRSRARNVVDLILPRLLLGDHLGAREIAALGQGGLLGTSEEEGGPKDGRSDA